MTEAGNPTGTAGIVVIVVGALNGLVALAFGFMALGELDRYRTLTRAGNPFAGLVANSWTYLAGTTAVAALTAVGLIVTGALLVRGRFRA